MSLNKRFKKSEVETVSVSERDKKLADAKLKLLEKKKKSEQSIFEFNELDIDDGNHYLERQAYCYRKINELFQVSSLSMYNVMKGLLEIVCVGIKAKGGTIWILQDDEIVCKVASGDFKKNVTGVKLNTGEGIIGWVFENRKSQVVHETKLDIRFKNTTGASSLIASPLIYQNEVIGVITVLDKKSQEGKFNKNDLKFIEDLSTSVAMHIKTNRVLHEQKLVLERLNNFTHLHEKFSSTIDLNELLILVLQKAINLLNAEVGSIWLVEEHGEGVECAYAVGPTKKKVEGLKLRRGVGIIGNIIEDQTGLVVEDCLSDERFSNLVDTKTNFVTRSMVASPFVIKGECIGAIQIINKRGNLLFSEEDLDVLNLFGSSAGMYLKNARLFKSEQRAHDFSALIDIGKQITSTLDLDAVLLTIVNLSSKLINFDESHMSVRKIGTKKNVQIRAISGQKEIDQSDTKTHDLQKIHNILIDKEMDEYYVPLLTEGKDILPEIKEFLEKYKFHSIWLKVLKDDQGELGVFSMLSEEGHFVGDTDGELLEILCSQSTVALRNVDLYNTIPSAHIVKNLKQSLLSKVKDIKSIPRKSWAMGTISFFVVILLLIFVKVPNNVSSKIEIVPSQFTLFSSVQGVVLDVFVKEGDPVSKGDLLMSVDVSDSKVKLLDKKSKKQKARVEMFKLKEEGEIADYKIKETEYISLDYEIKLLEKKIELSRIIAKKSGFVISENLGELVGKPVNFGEELIKISSKDKVVVQFEVPENDIQFVKKEQLVKFKIYGNPNKSFFEGIKLRSVAAEGRQVLESDPNKYYLAKADVRLNTSNNELKPGMTGRGKIFTEWQSLGFVLFSKIYNFFVMEVLF